MKTKDFKGKFKMEFTFDNKMEARAVVQRVRDYISEAVKTMEHDASCGQSTGGFITLKDDACKKIVGHISYDSELT